MTQERWRCQKCGSRRWVGWRAGPEHEGWPQKAQCVPCGHVQELPPKNSLEALRELSRALNTFREEVFDALRLPELVAWLAKVLPQGPRA